MQSLTIVNQSSQTLPTGWLNAADSCLQQGLLQVAYAWSEKVWHILAILDAQGFQIRLVDTLPEAPGALAYHDVDANGPFIRIGMKTIFDNGGDWYAGSLSIPSVISHETSELVGDPAANLWANDALGVSWARELCDATESDVYTVTAKDGTSMTLSNFVYPAYFNPFASGVPLDHMHVLTRPFQINKGGYAIRQSAGKITQVFNRDYPEWKKVLKHRALERASYGDLPVESVIV